MYTTSDNWKAYSHLALGALIATAASSLYLYNSRPAKDDAPLIPILPPTSPEDLPGKLISESAVHVSYRVTSDMADEHGRMYAGEILKLIDVVAGVASRRHSEESVVTISLDRFILVQEVRVGDLLHFSASVNRAWNTSMETGVKVVRESPRTGRMQYCCHAYLTFVALSPSPKGHSGPPASIRLAGRAVEGPRPRPKLRKITPTTLIEKKRYILAGHRRNLRIKHSKEVNGLAAAFRSEVLDIPYSMTDALTSPTGDEAEAGDLISNMEKEIVAEAFAAKDPAVLVTPGPDGDDYVSITQGLYDDMEPPQFRVSELEDLLKRRQKRGRRDTWSDPGKEITSDMKRNTSSWLTPSSPLKALGRRALEIPNSITEEFDTLSPLGEFAPLKTVPMEETYASTLHIVMPQHANSAGVLFGGQLMEWMEKVALIAAYRFRREDCCWTTACMDGLEFKEAAAIGDVMTFRAMVTRAWKSSIEVYVCSHADIPTGPAHSARFTNECFISLVALSSLTSTTIPVDAQLVIRSGTAAEKVSEMAHSRKADRLNMKEMLVRLYAATTA